MMLDPQAIRRQFPFLAEANLVGTPLAYLDSAATSQKPLTVLERMEKFLRTENGNVHRAMHPLSERATIAYENARKTVQKFLHAKQPEEIIFTKNATEAINLVARSWGASLKPGDMVVLSVLEHHSNIVPWLQLQQERGIVIEWMEATDTGDIDLASLDTFLQTGRVRMVAITGQSNVLGVRPPLTEIIVRVHAANAVVLVDAAQLVAHEEIDVGLLDCDFLAFSGHKVYGPTGVGVLYGKRNLLQDMPPFLGGGQMIQSVTRETFIPADLPARFEAGTPPSAEVIGLAAALEWIAQYSPIDRAAYEQHLLSIAAETLQSIPGLRLLGPTDNTHRHGCISFVIDGVHPHDLTQILGQQGIYLRAGHHCAQILHDHLGLKATTRLSVGIYNTEEEIRSVGPAIEEVMKLLKK